VSPSPLIFPSTPPALELGVALSPRRTFFRGIGFPLLNVSILNCTRLLVGERKLLGLRELFFSFLFFISGSFFPREAIRRFPSGKVRDVSFPVSLSRCGFLLSFQEWSVILLFVNGPFYFYLFSGDSSSSWRSIPSQLEKFPAEWSLPLFLFFSLW